MASVNISLTKEAYSFLKMLKDKDKSFSDVVLEFKNKGLEKKWTGKDMLKYFGILKDKGIGWRGVEKNIRGFRNEFNKRVEKKEW